MDAESVRFAESGTLTMPDVLWDRTKRWPVSDLCDELVAAGFDVVETDARTTTGQRSHGAILAVR